MRAARRCGERKRREREEGSNGAEGHCEYKGKEERKIKKHRAMISGY